MDALATQDAPAAHVQIGIAQIDRQNDVVLLDVRAEQQQRRVVQPQFETRQIARVAMIDAVRAAGGGDDVAARVENRKGMALLQRARPALLKRRGQLDVKARGFADFGRCFRHRGR